MGLPDEVAKPLRPCASRRHARHRAYPHGDRERRDDRAQPPLLHRARSLPGAQRLALQPQPPAPQNLRKRGIRFETDNDSEVAAAYLTWRLSEGASLREALEAGLKDLDGFYTFAVGTKDGFAVMRDAFACKPAVLAETDDWVAMSSEYRGIAPLPGAEKAKVWEPKPATVYAWGRA
jgi:glutamine phosphoribosylpyrophosphate amidotransferase